jgi:hypothetical protein
MKKIDVTDEAHEAAHTFCKTHGHSVKSWVSRLILLEVSRPDPKKPLVQLPEEQPTDAFRRPPFWAKA